MSSESRDWRRDCPRGGGGGRGRGRGRHAPHPRAPPRSGSAPPPAPSTAKAAAAPARSPPTDAAPIRGQCAAMCSEREQREREKEKEISRFERLDKGVATVKKYRRAAAGSMATLDPSEVRPPRVLLATLNHLFRVVMLWQGGGFALGSGDVSGTTSVQSVGDFLALYEFLSDRIRSVRQDFTVQHIEDALLESALEQIARFYALAGLRAVQLLDRSGDDKMRSFVMNWSDKLHDEQLASALVQLQALYRNQHASEDVTALSDTVLDRQAALVSLDLLLRLEDARGVALTLRRLPMRLRGRPRVRRALGAFVALQLDDFRAFFAHFQAMKVLEQALVLRQLPRVWASALKMLNKAFGKQDRVPLSELGAWLSLTCEGEDVATVEQLCSAMNLHVEHIASTEATAGAVEKPAPVDSWEQQDSNLETTSVKKALPSAFVRFKVNQPNAEIEASDAKKLMRSVALRHILRREREAGLSVSDLVVDGEA